MDDSGVLSLYKDLVPVFREYRFTLVRCIIVVSTSSKEKATIAILVIVIDGSDLSHYYSSEDSIRWGSGS